MKGPEHILLEESNNAFLAQADRVLCERLVDYLIRERNPAYLLAGDNPLLLRYYARLVIKVMRAAGHKVILCPPLLHREIPLFLNRVAAEKTVEAAMEPGVNHRQLLVFMHSPSIKREALVLLRDVQRNFLGLGLAYLYLGAPDLAMEESTTLLRLDEAAAEERLAYLDSPAAFKLPTRLVRHLRGQ
jgi:hypothetical protein